MSGAPTKEVLSRYQGGWGRPTLRKRGFRDLTDAGPPYTRAHIRVLRTPAMGNSALQLAQESALRHSVSRITKESIDEVCC